MVAINATEKEVISKKFPGIHIARTMKNDSKRHHYFCEEDPDVMCLLRQMRGQDAHSSKKGFTKQ